MPYKYRDMKWSEMTDREQELAGSKSEHKAAKAEYEANQAAKSSSPTPTPAPTPAPSSAQDLINKYTPNTSSATAPEPTPEPTPTASPEPSSSTSMMASSRDEPVTGPTFEPASSNEEPNRSAAVEKSQAYNNSGEYKFGDLKWSEMTDKQRDKAGSKADHKAAKNAADEIIQVELTPNLSENLAQEEYREIRNEAYAGTEKGSGERKGWQDRLDEDTSDQVNTLQDTIYGKDNIEDYNFAMGGTGSLKGKEAISKADLKGLQTAGFSDQEIIDHVNSERQGDAYIKGPKAQRFLDKMIAGLQSETPIVDPLPEIDDTQLIETPGINTGGTGGGVDTGDSGSNNDSTNTINIGGGNPGVGGGGQNPGVGGGGQNPGGSNNGGVDNSFNETINQTQDVDITQGNNQTFNVEQNNDLNSVITGDNNISNIEQNNSVSNIGGEQSNTANVTGSSANTSASGFLNNYLSQLPVLQNFYAAGGSFSGSSGSSGGSSSGSELPEMRTMDFQDGNGDGIDDRDQNLNNNNVGIGNSYNDLINQTQDVDVTESNDQNFNVTQDNDLNSQITGNNNVSNITQDNSVRNYGGDQRNFTYVSGSSANGVPNYLTDNPVSAATMSGYYAPNDSPASNAAFVDQYQTMNADAQKKYNPFGTAEGFMARGKNVGNMDMSVVNQMNLLRPEIAYARSDMANLNTYGDRYSAPGLKWNSALGVYEPIDQYDPEAIAELAQNMFK